MVELIKWFDRKFDFDFPVSFFPLISARLAGTPARLQEITSSLSHEELIKKENDSWSIQEHVGHLINLEELHVKRLNEFLNKIDELTAADLSNKKTYEADYNSKDIMDILNTFRKMRMDYVNVLDSLEEDTLSRFAYHPRLKQPMRLMDSAFFAAEHDDHHIAIIRNMISGMHNEMILK